MSGHLDPVSLPTEEPVSLARHSRMTFLDLPREMRDKIYYYSLHASKPLILYRSKGTFDEGWLDSSALDVFSDAEPDDPPQLAELGTGLFWSSHQVSSEARRVFYSCNTFSKKPGKPGRNWARLWTFLLNLGPVTRGHLRNLIVHPAHCDYAYETEDGTLYQKVRDVGDEEGGYRHDMYYKVCSPDARPPLDQATPAPRQPADHYPIDRVEILEPAMRACFRLLGAEGPKIRMVLKVHLFYFPGVLLKSDERYERIRRDEYGLGPVNERFFTTYVPQILERFAKEETAGRVEVVWEANCDHAALLDRREEIEKVGWEILEVKGEKRYRTTFTARWRREELLSPKGMKDLCIR